MTFNDYLLLYFSGNVDFKENVVNIRTLYQQEFSNNWAGIGNDTFRQEVEQLPDELCVTNIKSFFAADKYYKGYVAAMLWGGIGKGLGGSRNLSSAFNIDKKAVCKILKKIKVELRNNIDKSISKSYQALKGKCKIDDVNCKIAGIDESYFTKLLFFIGIGVAFPEGEVHTGKHSLVPLIYDNQMKKVHAALMKDDGLVEGYFNIGYRKTLHGRHFYVKQKSQRKNASKWRPVDFYIDYLKRMSLIAEKFNKSPESIEQILFGKSIQNKVGKTCKNPRYFVRQYLDEK